MQKKPTMAGIACEFAVRGVEERYVVFESIKFPGHYINVGKDSVAKLDAHPRGSHKVQFTIRINVSIALVNHVRVYMIVYRMYAGIQRDLQYCSHVYRHSEENTVMSSCLHFLFEDHQLS